MVPFSTAANALSGGRTSPIENAQPNGKPARPTATAPVAGSIGAAVVYGPGQDAGLLEVVDAVGQDAGGDDDEEDARDVEEDPQVDADHAAIDQVAEDDRDHQPEDGTDERVRGHRRASGSSTTGRGRSRRPRGRPR